MFPSQTAYFVDAIEYFKDTYNEKEIKDYIKKVIKKKIINKTKIEIAEKDIKEIIKKIIKEWDIYNYNLSNNYLIIVPNFFIYIIKTLLNYKIEEYKKIKSNIYLK